MAKNLQTVARRALTPCAGSDAFRFADGTSIRDLAGLRHAVAQKSVSLVAHHKLQFAPWVEQVLGDPALARKMERAAARRQLSPDGYRVEIVTMMDERIGKLKDRVI